MAIETGRRGGAGLSMRTVRQLHLYLGVLFAPSLLFFALTGAVQLFGLHEAKPGVDYHPPAIIEKLAEVHKNQRFALKPKRPAKPEGAHAIAAHRPAPRRPAPASPSAMLPVYLLKWFFLATALGLMASTGLGLWMGLKYGRNRRLAWGLLAAGVLIPVAILAL